MTKHVAPRVVRVGSNLANSRTDEVVEVAAPEKIIPRDLVEHRTAYSAFEVKAVDDDQRIIEGIATTPAVDRLGDVVEPLGISFKNPTPLLWMHNSKEPVGTVRFEKATEDGMRFRARLPKVTEPGRLKDRVDEAWQSVKLGLVRAVSIGFRGKEFNLMEDGGIRFVESEVLELSLVTIPANPEAAIQVVKAIKALNGGPAATGPKPTEGKPAGVTAQKPTRVVTKEGNMARKPINEQIKEFEATRAQKVGAMDLIMATAEEAGVTLDTSQKEECDDLAKDIGEIDEHIGRLRRQEALMKASAAPVVASDVASGSAARAPSEPRSVVRATGMKRNLPVGIPFTRYVMTLARSKGNLMEALHNFEGNKNWMNETPEIATVLRAAVTAGTTTDSTWAAPLVEYQVLTSEFIEFLRPRTIIGRIDGLRRVPFKVKVPRQTAVASVNWVGETKPKPLGKGALDSVTLDHYKIAGIIVLSMELVRLSNPSAETIARDDLARGIIQLMDNDFVDADKALVANVSPAGLPNGVTPVAASGTGYANFVTDFTAVMRKFFDANIDPASLVVVMTQAQALQFSLMETTIGVKRFPDLTMNGGTLAGLPVITSENIPFTEGSPQEGSPIIFIKANDILLADEGGVQIDISREASVQMNDAPDDPVTASTVLVSLWQQNLVGIRAERMINWAKARAAAVQYISAAKYVPS